MGEKFRILKLFLYEVSMMDVFTSQNSTPLTELPNLSSGGDHTANPPTFGITKRITPAMLDFAGSPT